MFSFHSKVRFSETGADEKLTLPAIINYFQDCSEFHSEAVGGGAGELGKYAWILSSWQIQISRYANRSEEIEIATIPHGLKGIQGDRNFLIKDSKGEVIVNANSIWTYVDKENQRPLRITPEQYDIYPLEEPFLMDYAPRKISLRGIASEQWCFLDKVQVHLSQLDMFGHMNNGQYVTLACDYLPTNYPFHQLRVEYKKSARFGDTIVISRCQLEDRILFQLANEQGDSYTILEFS